MASPKVHSYLASGANHIASSLRHYQESFQRKIKPTANSELSVLLHKPIDVFDRPAMVQDIAKTQKGLAQKHLHSRISYLYQAARHLAKSADQSQVRTNCVNNEAKKQSKPSEELQCAVISLEAVSDTGLSEPPTEQAKRICKIKPDDGRVFEESALSRQLVVHLRAISLKSQIRLSPAMKHTICKRCDSLLVPGSTSTSYMMNNSRGGRKPWADVLVTTCTGCGTAKRFPVGAKRHLRRESRIGKARDVGK